MADLPDIADERWLVFAGNKGGNAGEPLVPGRDEGFMYILMGDK